jgi:2-aminoadipate transaminase
VANFQNPTGGTLSPERRRHLADLADTYGFLIVEDDPYGELRFEGAPLPGLATLSERVIHLGSFSKILFPGLRLGYLAAPASLQPALLKMKQAADLHSSTWSQRLLIELLADEAEMAAHVDGLRALYKDRRDALLGALETHIGPHAAWNRPHGGMFTWMRLGRARAVDLFDAALRRRVAFVPGAPFFTGVPDASSLRLSYSTLPPAELEAAVADLGAALREVVAAA